MPFASWQGRAVSLDYRNIPRNSCVGIGIGIGFKSNGSQRQEKQTLIGGNHWPPNKFGMKTKDLKARIVLNPSKQALVTSANPIDYLHS